MEGGTAVPFRHKKKKKENRTVPFARGEGKEMEAL